MWEKGNVHERVNKLRYELNEVQRSLDRDPDNVVIRQEERVYLQCFNEAKLEEQRFLKQVSKIKWLREGDNNTTYFHKVVRGKRARSRVHVIRIT